MLTILQALTLVSGFFLPWTIGGLVKFHKEGKEKARNLAVAGLVLCCVIISLTVWLTFSALPSAEI